MNETQIKAAVNAIAAMAEAIRELKEVPSGHLYAVLCGKMSLEQYNNAIRLICDTGLVELRGHVLRWVGP